MWSTIDLWGAWSSSCRRYYSFNYLLVSTTGSPQCQYWHRRRQAGWYNPFMYIIYPHPCLYGTNRYHLFYPTSTASHVMYFPSSSERVLCWGQERVDLYPSLRGDVIEPPHTTFGGDGPDVVHEGFLLFLRGGPGSAHFVIQPPYHPGSAAYSRVDGSLVVR